MARWKLSRAAVLMLALLPLVSGCGSSFDRPTSIGSGTDDYKRSPCAAWHPSARDRLPALQDALYRTDPAPLRGSWLIGEAPLASRAAQPVTDCYEIPQKPGPIGT